MCIVSGCLCCDAQLAQIHLQMLAGYLKKDTMLYVWDQYVIGLDVPGFGTEWLAVVCATMLGLLQDKLKEAKSVSWECTQQYSSATCTTCNFFLSKFCTL